MLKKFTITLGAVAMLAASAVPALADGKLGAVASSENSYGVAYTGATRAEARSMAMAKCKAMAAKTGDTGTCKLDIVFAHCAAIAQNASSLGYGYGDKMSEAKDNAMKVIGAGAKMSESGCVGK